MILAALGYVGGGLCEIISQQAIVYRGAGATKSALLLLPGKYSAAVRPERTIDITQNYLLAPSATKLATLSYLPTKYTTTLSY